MDSRMKFDFWGLARRPICNHRKKGSEMVKMRHKGTAETNETYCSGWLEQSDGKRGCQVGILQRVN